MDTKKPRKQSKFSKFMKAPLKILVKARDFYVKSMVEYSDRIGYGTVMGCPTGHAIYNLPKSYSVNASKSSRRDKDYSELLRAASTRGLRSNNGSSFDSFQRQQKSPNRSYNKNNNNNNMQRCRSVAIGRIDEDQACENFDDDFKIKSDFTRSRSYAVSGTRRINGVH